MCVRVGILSAHSFGSHRKSANVLVSIPKWFSYNCRQLTDITRIFRPKSIFCTVFVAFSWNFEFKKIIFQFRLIAKFDRAIGAWNLDYIYSGRIRFRKLTNSYPIIITLGIFSNQHLSIHYIMLWVWVMPTHLAAYSTFLFFLPLVIESFAQLLLH